MKTMTYGNGQIVEIYNLKEIKYYVIDNYVGNIEYVTDDQSLWIEYNDGTTYQVVGCCEYGKFKRTGIKRVIEDNGATYAVYGEYTPRFENECLYID